MYENNIDFTMPVKACTLPVTCHVVISRRSHCINQLIASLSGLPVASTFIINRGKEKVGSDCSVVPGN